MPLKSFLGAVAMIAGAILILVGAMHWQSHGLGTSMEGWGRDVYMVDNYSVVAARIGSGAVLVVVGLVLVLTGFNSGKSRGIQSSFASSPSAVSEGGRFRVSGVDKESGFDTSMVIDAESEANAKVKAELKGIVVTSVAKFPSE